MITSIVVPIAPDGAGCDALAFATRLGAATGARVRILTAVAPGGAADIPNAAGREVVEYADAALAVRDAVDGDPGALVCMTTHASRSLTALVLGSTAQSVLASVDAPVVLVGPAADPRRSIERIVVAVRPCSVRSGHAIEPAADIALASGAAITLVSVGATGEEPDLELARQQALALGIDVETRAVAADEIASGLLEVAEEVGASLIAMTSHGRGPLLRVALGSIALDVVRGSPCPVLVVPQRPSGRS